MQFVGKAKIGRLLIKGIEYPQLRLPRKYSHVVGKTAETFAAECEGKQAFLIVTECGMPNKHTILKPNKEVLKYVDENNLNRPLKLES